MTSITTWKDASSAENIENQRINASFSFFIVEGPSEFVTTEITGPLSGTKTGNKFIFIMTDHYSEATRAIPTKKTTATDVAKIFVEDWIVPYGTLENLLMDIDPQLLKSSLMSFALHWVQN